MEKGLKDTLRVLTIAGSATLASMGVLDSAIKSVAGPDAGFVSTAKAACNDRVNCINRWRRADRQLRQNVQRGPRSRKLNGASCSRLSDHYDNLFNTYYRKWVANGRKRAVKECAQICQLKKDELVMVKKCGASQSDIWRIKAQISRFCINDRSKRR